MLYYYYTSVVNIQVISDYVRHRDSSTNIRTAVKK